MKRKIISISLVLMMVLNIFAQNSIILAEGDEDQAIDIGTLDQVLEQNQEEPKVASDAAAQIEENEKILQKRILIQPTRGGKDMTDLVKITKKEVFQDGVEVPDGGNIDTSKDITISFQFAIPVFGDQITDENEVVIKGDYAEFKVASGVIAKAPLTFDLIGPKLKETDSAGKKVGTAELNKKGEETWVKINFDGDDVVFDGNLSRVTAWFSAKFQVKQVEGNNPNPGVTIFEKDYETTIPTVNRYEIKKNGSFNLKTKKITWTITIEGREFKGKNSEEKELDLGGFTLVEDLTKAGEYVDESLKMDDDETDGEIYDSGRKRLTYVFPDGTKTPQTLTLETQLSLPEVYNRQGVQKLNWVFLKDKNNKEVSRARKDISVTYNWGYKKSKDLGKEYIQLPMGHDSGISPSNTFQKFQWEVVVDPNGDTLYDVKILEKDLDSRLEFIRAYVREEGSHENKVLPETDSNYYDEHTREYTGIPTKRERNRVVYQIGTVTKKTTLYIEVRREWDDSALTEYYHNDAYLLWKGRTDDGHYVGDDYHIGASNTMEKYGDMVWNQGSFKWTVNVPSESWKDLANPVVLDLLIRDPDFNFDKNTILNNIRNLKLRNGQSHRFSPNNLVPLHRYSIFKYKEGSFVDVSGVGLKHEVIALYNNQKKHVADILKVTLADPANADKTKDWQFTFEGYQMRRDHLINDGREPWSSNTARLLDGGVKKTEDFSGHNYFTRPLNKEMIKGTAIDDLKQMPKANLVNQIASSHEAFNHKTGSIIYRLSINGGNHPFLHEALGDFTLTDTLPDGWEFVNITDNKKYVVFEGEPYAEKPKGKLHEITGSVKAIGDALDDIPGMKDDFGDGKVVFTFTEDLKHPYVILLEARPKADKMEEYRQSGKRIDVTNIAELSEKKQKLKVSRQVRASFFLSALDKTKVTKGGSIVWTINFNPDYIVIPDGHKIKLVDHLSEGIDVRIDEQGKPLLIGSNYKLYDERNKEVALEGILTYDKAGRNLILELPEKKEYRFVYITDVTGAPGKKISNTVRVEGISGTQIKHEYDLLRKDAGADYTVNTYVEIHKRDADGPLAGAEFTLKKSGVVLKTETSDGTGIIRFNKLPEGEYTIEETKAPHGYANRGIIYYVSIKKEAGKLVAYVKEGDAGSSDRKNQILVMNERLGGLEITKTIESNNPSTTDEFTFRLTLSGNGSDKSYTLTRFNAAGVEAERISVRNGSEFKLKHGEKAVIKGLPQGLRYAVEEIDAGNYEKLTPKQEGQIGVNAQSIKFVNKPAVINIPVEKKWIGPKTASIKVYLQIDGKDVVPENVLILNETNQWKGQFKNLPKYDAKGAEINYGVREEVPVGYEGKNAGDKQKGFVITNTNIEKIEIPVEKKWIGPKAPSIKVYLQIDGKDVVPENALTLDENNQWKGKFENLPKYKADGTEINYGIREEVPAGYQSKIAGNRQKGFVITNTSTEKISIPVEKKWVGPKKSSIKVYLQIDGQDAKPANILTLNEANQWKGQFKNLPKYHANGTEINYGVREEVPAGYKEKIAGNRQKGFVITNTNIEKIEIPVEKKWVGPKKSSIKVYLQINGKDAVPENALTLNEANQWKGKFKNLPKYDANGAEINYSVREEVPAGYKEKIAGNKEKGFVITNTNIEKIEIPVEKKWIGPKKSSIKVYLQIDGKDAVPENTLTLNEANKWKGQFKNLPKYHANGAEINYGVREEVPAGYEGKITGDKEKGFVITNTNIEKIEIPVEKKWVGPKVPSIKVYLQIDGKDVVPENVLTLGENNQWKGKFENLPKYKADGTEINYSVREEVPAGYEGKIAGDKEKGFVITNTNIEKIEIPVEKKWIGPKTLSIKVYLQIDGKDADPVKVLTLNETNQWKGQFKNLPKYHANGAKINYGVREEVPAGYEGKITGDKEKGFVITNTNIEKVKIPVKKIWRGRPKDQVVIQLVINGVPSKDPKHTLYLEANNIHQEYDWKASFDDLPKYDKDGNEIKYTIKEVKISGYDSKIDGDMNKGFTVTNTELTNIKVKKVWYPAIPVPAKEVVIKVTTIEGNLPKTYTYKLDGVVDEFENPAWELTINNLLAYDPVTGVKRDYKVEEISVDGFISTKSGDEAKGYTFTNVKTKDIEITKNWIGPIHPSIVSVNIQLYRQVTGGLKEKVGSEVELKAITGWKHTFKNLPITDQAGKEYIYSVDEVNVPAGYEKNIKGLNITNKNVTERSIKVVKDWVDDDNKVKKRPASIKVILKANGKQKDTVTLPKGTSWEHTFTGLRQYDDQGKLIIYTIEEVKVPNYNTAISGQDEANGVLGNEVKITNTIEGKVSIPVTKKWIGPKASVTVNLLADNVKVDSVVLDQSNGWQHTFKNKPEYNGGKKIVYTVEEVVPAGYTKVSSTGNIKDGFVITNRSDATTKLVVEKKWVGPATDKVVVKLLADRQDTGKTVELHAGNGWKAEFIGLRKYHETDGHEIVYTVEEVVPQNYAPAYDESTAGKVEITNTNIEKIEIPVEKKWLGDKGKSATIHLWRKSAKDAEQKVDSITLRGNEAEPWKHTFKNLDKYSQATGELYEYFLKEDAVDGYHSSITGFVVTNRNDALISIPVKKIWEGSLASEVIVRLWNGTVQVGELKLSAANNWQGSFNNLRQFDETTGLEINYTLTEDRVPSFETEITGDKKNGFTVKNRYVPPYDPYYPPTPPTPTPPTPPTPPTIPPTTDIPDGEVPEGNTPPTPPTPPVPDVPKEEIPNKPENPPTVPFEDEGIPQGNRELPKTSGTPAEMLYLMGIALVGLGGLLKRKTK